VGFETSATVYLCGYLGDALPPDRVLVKDNQLARAAQQKRAGGGRRSPGAADQPRITA
nr:hypothetical protein [Tanacetum cinerariifolium]